MPDGLLLHGVRVVNAGVNVPVAAAAARLAMELGASDEGEPPDGSRAWARFMMAVR